MKKILPILPLALGALAGCSNASSDSGDSGIVIHEGTAQTPPANSAAASIQNNPNIPQTAKDAMTGKGK
jgi:hypothetical protein